MSTTTSLVKPGHQEQDAPRLFTELVQEGAAAMEKRNDAARERSKQSVAERQQAAKDHEDHEPGSRAAESQRQAGDGRAR